MRYVRNESNIGHYRNMNRCLELARGEYVCVIHDDDVYAPAFLERESAVLERHPNVGMVHCAVYVVDPERNRLRIRRAYPDTRILDGRREFVRYLRGHNVCCSTVMAMSPAPTGCAGCRRRSWSIARASCACSVSGRC